MCTKILAKGQAVNYVEAPFIKTMDVDATCDKNWPTNVYGINIFLKKHCSVLRVYMCTIGDCHEASCVWVGRPW